MMLSVSFVKFDGACDVAKTRACRVLGMLENLKLQGNDVMIRSDASLDVENRCLLDVVTWRVCDSRSYSGWFTRRVNDHTRIVENRNASTRPIARNSDIVISGAASDVPVRGLFVHLDDDEGWHLLQAVLMQLADGIWPSILPREIPDAGGIDFITAREMAKDFDGLVVDVSPRAQGVTAFPLLSPPRIILERLKAGKLDDAGFMREYARLVLDQLDWRRVAAALFSLGCRRQVGNPSRVALATKGDERGLAAVEVLAREWLASRGLHTVTTRDQYRSALKMAVGRMRGCTSESLNSRTSHR